MENVQSEEKKKVTTNRMKEISRRNIPDNPCLRESKMSVECIDRVGYDPKRQKDECAREFQNYKNCKRFWASVEAQRRKKGITPTLPPPEEREEMQRKMNEEKRKFREKQREIRQEYFEKIESEKNS